MRYEAMTVLTIERIERWNGQEVRDCAGEKAPALELVHSDRGRLPADNLGTWTRGRRASIGFLVCVVLIALAGCGSSKPGYCTNRTNLENSIKGLTSLNASSVSGLRSQLEKVRSDATALINSAKSDFPTQTSAIKSSLATFESAVKGLPSSPSASQIASVASSASGVVSSVRTFVSDSKSKCS